MHRVDVDLVVMHGVQGRRSRRGHPRGGRAGLGLTDLLLDHVGHQLRHRPHALADLGPAGEPGRQTDVDVLVLVGLDPVGGLHRALADHRPGVHRRVDLVAGAVQETGVDEHHPVSGGFDAGLEVDRGAALLVHDADLEGVLRQAEHVLDAAEQLTGERDLVGSVHLGLDDVDGAGAAVDQRAVGSVVVGATAQPVDGDQAGEQRVLNAFGHLVALGVGDRVIGHQVPDVAHEHQAAPGQRHLATVGAGVGAVLVEHPGERLVTLADLFAEVAAVEAEPVAVSDDLVVGVDGGDGILEVHDGGDRGLQHDVLDAGLVGGTDGGVGVDEDLDVQAVVDQQHGGGRFGVAEVADELLRCLQADGAAVVEGGGNRAVGHRDAGDVRP